MTTLTREVAAARARQSTIVLKLSMAFSGIVFLGYLLLHMYGNLKVFGGQNAFDEYAHHLRVFGEPMLPGEGLLWIVRVLLIVSLLVHAYAALRLWRLANRARPRRYVVKKAVVSTLASRTMRWGGLAILFFVIFHLLHLTFRVVTPGSNSDSPYRRLVAGFEPEYWWMTVIYLLALVALGMHLRHGVWSAAQTLGWTSTPTAAVRARRAGIVVAVVITVGFAIVPLSVLVGIVE